MLKCVLVDRDGETSRIVENVARATGQMTVVKRCSTMHEAGDLAIAKEIDLLLLDVMTPDLNKKEFLDRSKNAHSRMIALGNKKESAVDAYELNAIDFILKPLTIDSLLRALKKVLQVDDRALAKKNPFLFVKVNTHFERVDMRNIFEIEAMSDYVHIYTKEKRYTVHSTLKGIESKLPDGDFVRVHKSFIVRIDCVSEIEKDTLTVEKKIIPLSLTYKKHLMDHLNIV